MYQNLVRFLDSFSIRAPDHDFAVRLTRKRSPIPTEHAYGFHLALPGGLKSVLEISSFAAGAEQDKNVSSPAKAFNLPAEDPVISEIIGNTGNGSAIRNQRNGRQRCPVCSEPTHEFFCHMQCFRRTPTVAGGQDFAPILETGHDQFAHSGYAVNVGKQ
jgi:hypothetical protein